MEKIILVGAGGHSKVVIDAIMLAGKYKIAAITDKKERIGSAVLGLSIAGDDSVLKDCFRKGITNCFIAIGSIGNPVLRIKLFNLSRRIGFEFPNIIHPGAVISKFAKLGCGNYIAPGAIINAGAVIGNNCIINTACVVEHDSVIGDFAHIGPGVTMGGGVSVDKCSLIGIGSSVRQYLKIGKNTIIGAGSVVVDDIDDNVIAMGNPCRKMRNNAR